MRFIIAILFVALSFSSHAGAAEAKLPNVIVFLVDDMGVMDTSVPFLTDSEGRPQRFPLNDYYRTPSMKRLAATGIRFNNFYAMSVCSPTRISIMTGQNAARHHATNWINPRNDNRGPKGPPNWNWKGLKKSNVTLPRVLAGHGYRTIHVGKGHFGPDGSPGGEPLNLGFDINVGGASFGAPGSYYAEDHYGANTRRKHHAVPHLEAYHGSDTFLTEALTIETKKHLTATVKDDKPFYLYMSHYAVHGPFHSDPRFAANYAESGKPKNAQAFATLIEGMDKSLGDLLDHVTELGVAENTLVFFLGDNGSDAPLGHQHEVACAAPLRGKKGAHYEGGMRVPFIASWAARNEDNPHQQKLPIPAGVIQSQLGAVQDLFPTILNLVKAAGPKDHIVDGYDLTKMLLGQNDPKHPEEFLMHYPHSPHRSDYFSVFRDGEWKVIYHYFPSKGSEGTHYQLYHLGNDPYESTNLATQEPVQLKKMMSQLDARLKRHGALYPVAGNDDTSPVKPILP